MNQLQQIPVLDSVLVRVGWSDLVERCRFVCKFWRSATMREISRRICTVMRNEPLYTSRIRFYVDRPRLCDSCEQPFAKTDTIWRYVHDADYYPLYYCAACRGERSLYCIAFDHTGSCTMGGLYIVYDYGSRKKAFLPFFGSTSGNRYGHKGYPLHAHSDPYNMDLYLHRRFVVHTIDTCHVEMFGSNLCSFEWGRRAAAMKWKCNRKPVASMNEIEKGYLGQVTDWVPVRMQDHKSGLLCINRDHHLYGKCMTEW